MKSFDHDRNSNNSIDESINLHQGSSNKYTVKYLKNGFFWFSLIASLNHALNYVVNSYSTTLLTTNLGGVSLGLNWILNAVSGLTFATPVVRRFGFKNSMIISFWGYSIQLATLYIAVIWPEVAWPVVITGSVIAGFTSAVWWTAQGVCFELTCQKIYECLLESNDDHNINNNTANGLANNIRSNLSANWTMVYQISDIVVFLSLSLLPYFANYAIRDVLLLLVFLGISTALLGHTFFTLDDHGGSLDFNQIFSAIIAVPVQFVSDCRPTLLAPFVFGFGITTAMFSYYLNDAVVSDSDTLGPVAIGFLEAFSYLIATLSAFPYAYVSNKISGGQHLVIQFGSICFMLTGTVVYALSDSELGTWRNILIIKGMYGLGRGVFEGSCRAVYAEMFVGRDLSTAFSGQTLLAGFSGGVCYFIYGILSRQKIAMITVINGVIAVIFYGILMFINYTSPLSWYGLLQKLFSWINPYYKPQNDYMSIDIDLKNTLVEADLSSEQY